MPMLQKQYKLLFYITGYYGSHPIDMVSTLKKIFLQFASVYFSMCLASAAQLSSSYTMLLGIFFCLKKMTE